MTRDEAHAFVRKFGGSTRAYELPNSPGKYGVKWRAGHSNGGAKPGSQKKATKRPSRKSGG